MRSRLLALVLLALVPMAGQILYHHIGAVRREIAQIQQDSLALADSGARRFGLLLENTRKVATVLAQLDEVRGDDAEACGRLLADLHPRFAEYDNLSVVRADGTVFASGLPFDPELNATALLCFRRAMATRAFAVGEPRISRITKKPTLNFAYPIADSAGNVQRMVIVSMSLKWLTEKLLTEHLPVGTVLSVLDHNGTVLARTQGTEEWVGKTLPEAPLVAHALRETGGVAELRGLDGVNRIYAFQTVPSPGGDFRIVTGIPRQVALADVWRQFRGALLWLGLVTALVLGAAWFVADAFVLWPAAALVAATRRLETGDLSARAAVSPHGGELATLALAFNDLAAALQARNAERKRAEEALKLFRALVDRSNDTIEVIDPETGRFLDVNEKGCADLGYSRQELLSLRVPDVDPGMDPSSYPEVVKQLRKAGSWSMESRHLRKDGTPFPVEINLSYVQLDRDYIVAVVRDITERKRAEEELHQTYARELVINETLRLSLVEASIVDLLRKALDSLLTVPNLALERKGAIFLVEAEPGVLVLKASRGLAGPLLAACARVPFGNCLCGRAAASGELQFADNIDERHDTRYDGIQPHGHYCVPMRIGDRTIGVLALYLKAGCARDERVEGFIMAVANALAGVVARKRAEEELRESEASLSQAQRIAHLGSWQWDVQTGESDCSEEMCRILGFDPQKSPPGYEAFLQVVHPDDRETLQREVGLALNNVKPFNLRFRIVRPNGEQGFVEARAEVILDEGGRALRMIGTALDVTERKNLEEQLVQAQKMEAIGKLAGGVAHDFNNILTGIIGYAKCLLPGMAEGSRDRGDVSQIIQLGERASDLTRQLLAFSRKQMLQPVILNLNNVLGDMIKMLPRVLREDIDLRFLPADDLGNVKADPGQIAQVLINLAVNARDAMPEGGRLTIETANVTLGPDYAKSHAMVPPGPYVRLAVSDTGCGMDKQTRERLFEPFFTTKERGKGTGLGLSTIFGIVKQHNGYIWVYSEPGQGTTFRIYLPRLDEPAPLSRPEAPSRPLKGTETILLVEDEEAVRDVSARVLSAQGYRVLAAASADEAKKLFAQHEEDVALLLTDVILPRESGPVLYEELAGRRPALKVLYMSGYTDNAVVHHGVLEAGVSFIGKPFGSEDLGRAVRKALDG
ncbi:MAG: PAS domain S-box protein [Planctomycetota bacterium]